MKRIICFLMVLILLSFVGCGENKSAGKKEAKKGKNTQVNEDELCEEIAASCVEGNFKCDYETYLSSYPKFRLMYRAVSYGCDRNASYKEVAKKMKAKGNEARKVEILSSTVLEHKKPDASIYNEISENYEVTVKSIGKIQDMCTVNVEYLLESGSEFVALDDEIECIKIDGEWYVYSDMAYTN